MAHLQIDDAAVFYRTFADLLVAGEDDKHMARKLGCSRGEIKRRRQAFQKGGIVTERGVSKEKLDAWLASNEGPAPATPVGNPSQATKSLGRDRHQTAKGIPQTARSQTRLDAAKGLTKRPTGDARRPLPFMK